MLLLLALPQALAKSRARGKSFDSVKRVFLPAVLLLLALPQALATDVPFPTEHNIDATFGGASSVFAADVDGDGDTDVLGAALEDDDITWWENTDGSGTTWIEHTVDANFGGAFSVFAADVDGDGDTDVLGAALGDADITWWENTDGAGATWTEHTVDANFIGAFSVFAADVDGDGDTDVLGAAEDDNEIAWWENTDGAGAFSGRQTVDGTFGGARSVFAADVDGDGDTDVLGAAFGANDIAWWENTDGAGAFSARQTVDNNFNAAVSVFAADVDGDGDTDVLGAGDESITWWENGGGQFGLPTTSTAPAMVQLPSQHAVLRIDAVHNGRVGDTDVELATLELLFDDGTTPLTSGQANSLIEDLHVYLDNGSGSFEPGSDTLVTTVGTLALTSGVQAVSFPDGNANVQVLFGTPRSYFVVLDFVAGGLVNSLRVSHLTESSSAGEDRDNDIPLSLEFTTNVSTPTITTPADVTIDKTFAPNPATAGGQTAVTLTAMNVGGSEAQMVMAQDILQAGLSFASSSNCSETGGTVTCDFGAVAPGATPVRQFMVNLAPDITSAIANTATISTGTTESNVSNNSDTEVLAVNAEADLSVTKTGPAQANAGSDITYQFTVTNSGPSDASAVQLVDNLPASLTRVSVAAGGGFACPGTEGDTTITCDLATLALGSEATGTIIARVPAMQPGGDVSNLASIGAATSDPNVGNDTDTAVTAIHPQSTITSLSPMELLVESDDFVLSVVGTGFLNGDTIDWNGTPLDTEFVGEFELRGTVPAALLTTPGDVSVTVVRTIGAPSNAVVFTINGPPIITNLDLRSAEFGEEVEVDEGCVGSQGLSLRTCHRTTETIRTGNVLCLSGG